MFSMEDEPYIRLFFFFGIFAVMTVWEIMAPKRTLTASKAVRWFGNLVITFFNSFILRMFFPVLARGTAYWCKDNGCGLLNLLGMLRRKLGSHEPLQVGRRFSLERAAGQHSLHT